MTWRDVARPDQLPPPGKWRVWALITGRGWGKTRTESEWAHDQAAKPGSVGFIGCRTLKDARKTIIGHPRSGLLATARKENPCRWLKQDGVIRWANGATADIHTSEEPDSARGPEYEWGIADEVGTWKRVVDFEGNTLFDNLNFALRGGDDPRMIVGTTPRRGSKAVRYLVESGQGDPIVVETPDGPVHVATMGPPQVVETPDGPVEAPGVALTRGSLLANRENLPEPYIAAMLDKYGGTHLARQEIEGELLPEVEGALVTAELIETHRTTPDQVPDFVRVAVGLDPSGGRVEQGIVAVGKGVDGRAYVLEDASCLLKPEGWGLRAVSTLQAHSGDLIVAERNFGGDMVESTIRVVDPKVHVKSVTASRGKTARFEPVGALYQQGRVRHVGNFDKLEDEVMCFTPEAYEGEDSPNRGDALAWAVHELMLQETVGPTPDDLYGRGNAE